MTERQFECIRALATLARETGATKSSVRRRMLAAGWTDTEIQEAIAAISDK